MVDKKRPIDQEWIQRYVDSVLRFATDCGDTPMGRSAALRADHIMDMVEAWQRSGEPLDVAKPHPKR